ncbi:hypothetical protein HW115_05670 [Verrucomicrobiaceae bacterium N1E253]|uniref:Uncharacterized protein n=1 Tax=Oceaniferula marina TaxID=2748318 RepID=A0A851GBG5_9BACT|nr:hypothetical protein [Oceaniferula marina]NWK55088.1 hypothetical protein [Oceaniferula marina]
MKLLFNKMRLYKFLCIFLIVSSCERASTDYRGEGSTIVLDDGRRFTYMPWRDGKVTTQFIIKADSVFFNLNETSITVEGQRISVNEYIGNNAKAKYVVISRNLKESHDFQIFEITEDHFEAEYLPIIRKFSDK